jgi:cobalt-zinc-cadmium efflux system outer membrane protein
MAARRLLPLVGPLLLSGCLYHVREQVDQAAVDMAAQAFDPAPASSNPPASLPPPREVQTTTAKAAGGTPPLPDLDVRTTSWLQRKDERGIKDVLPPQLKIPERIPGSEAKLIKLPADKEKRAAEVRQLYPRLPVLPDYPRGDPGPSGLPYTLTELHRIAALNSPTLRQALADVETARGNMIQASMYPNPNFGWEADPSNNGSTAGVQGVYIEQMIKTAGKLKIQTAAALKDLENAELALKRARSDLATQVRSAYFTFLVARETVEVTRALAAFTDEIYRLQANLLVIDFAAAYEPAALRASAYTARLAYRQAIESYIYNWKQLAAAVGARDLPLGQVAGQVDQYIPRFDYNTVLAHVLKNHTDVLTARNAIEKQKYSLKFAQVTPIPDVDVRFTVQKEMALAPFNWVHTLQFGIVLPIWDQNKGAILAAEGTLGRALQEPRRVELTLSNGLAGAFATYRNNVDALEAYRKEILPDLVRMYRGVNERRRIDPNAQFGDLVAAQSALVTGVTTYLTTLGSLWSSIVTLTDFLQTDDLFQLGKAEPLAPLGGIEMLPPRMSIGPGPAGAPPGVPVLPAAPDAPALRAGPPAPLPALAHPSRLPPADDGWAAPAGSAVSAGGTR